MSTTETMEPPSREAADLELVLKYDGTAPRYTSYPPANFFTPVSSQTEGLEMVETSNRAHPRNLSFYVHVPFCPRRCLFCGCHTEIGRPGEFVRRYMDALLQEFRLLAPRLDRQRPVTQIHFGGGTPNAAPYSSLATLLRAIAGEFQVLAAAEIAIECDPGLILPEKLEDLRGMGFNRVSFGIQDVDERVLNAVNRRPSRMAHPELVRTARDLGFRGINLDLIHGLPLQTPESFRRTAEAIVAADPDRISLFPYAHVPWVKGHQGDLEKFPMPDARDRIRMAMEARGIFLAAGYEAVGTDHFAKPADELAVAKRTGELHRNFQGYCVQSRAGQVHALGASGISQIHAGYLQNEKDTAAYQAKVETGELPFTSAYRMQPQDRAVRKIINGLMCHGSADLDAALNVPDLDPKWAAIYRAESLVKLVPLQSDGLVEADSKRVTVTPKGFYLGRIIAAAFDPRIGASAPKFSRAL